MAGEGQNVLYLYIARLPVSIEEVIVRNIVPRPRSTPGQPVSVRTPLVGYVWIMIEKSSERGIPVRFLDLLPRSVVWGLGPLM